MNVIEAIYKRKSIRKFKDEAVPKEDIIKMLEAAAEAPSPKHQQNWNFVVVTNKNIINKMAEIVTESHEELGRIAKTEKDRAIHMSVIKYYTCFKNAPAVVMVYSSEYKMIEKKILMDNGAAEDVINILESPQSAAQGIGAAVENFLLAATEMGYGTCYMTGPAHAKTQLEKLIGFGKPGFELMSMIALGVPDENTSPKPPRKPLEDVVTFIE